MKRINKFFGLLVATLSISGVLVSCNNDLNGPKNDGPSGAAISPVVAPDLVIWSGNQTLYNSFTGQSITTRGTSVTGNDMLDYWYPGNVDPEDEDIKYVIEFFSSDANVIENFVNVNDIPFETYYVQQVYGHDQLHAATNKSGEFVKDENCSNHMDQLGARDAQGNLTNFDSFNRGNNDRVDNCSKNDESITAKGTVLMKEMATSITPGKQFAYHESTLVNVDSENNYYFNYRIIKYKGHYYVGFDYESHDNKDNTSNQGQVYNIERNWKFNDWIVRIVKAVPKTEPQPVYDPQDTDLNFGDPSVDNGNNGNGSNSGNGDNSGNNNGNGGGTGDNSGNGGSTGNNQGNGTNKYNNNEVEINLALNDIHTLPNGRQKYDIADLVSKLSIHVRYPHDVEVIMPVYEAFYCNQDDLYILNDHYTDGAYGSNPYVDENGDFKGIQHTISYTVADNPVSVIITYVPASEDYLNDQGPANFFTYEGEQIPINMGGYITVRTQGINQDVIDYCRENFGDGINFEVYNYYNRGNMYTTGKYAEIGMRDMQFNFLSRSMVNFDWQQQDETKKAYPDFYINAFNQLQDGYPNPNDCYVWVLGDTHANRSSNIGVFTRYHHLWDGTLLKGWRDLNYKDNNFTIQSNHFTLPYQGTHFNSSPYNWIYTNKQVKGAVDSNDMLNERDGWWPFAKGNGSLTHNHFKIGDQNFYYYDFDTRTWLIQP